MITTIITIVAVILFMFFMCIMSLGVIEDKPVLVFWWDYFGTVIICWNSSVSPI